MVKLNKKVLFTSVALLFVFFSIQQLQAVDTIDVKQTQSLTRQGALLLDVREPDEYREAHAPDATLIPLGQLGERVNEIAAYKDKPVNVICRSGVRSAKAARLLQNAGFSQVNNVDGGMTAWEKADLSVIRESE
ncbi:MAG: rhodanese-like domain-containing protein [Pseudomonadota bacterium]